MIWGSLCYKVLDAPTQTNGEALRDTLNLSQGTNIASPKLSFRYYKLEESKDSYNAFYIDLDGKSRSSIKTDVIHMTENARRTIVWLVFATGLQLRHKG